MSPRIMNVAVPLPKHSPMFGHEASSHTVCRFCARRMRLMSWKRESGIAARTRIHAGFASASRGTILMGMRAVFFAPFSFTPASRMLEVLYKNLRQLETDRANGISKTKVLHLRHGEAGVAARVDRAKWREVHFHVEREAVIGAAPRNPDAERRDFCAADIDARSAGT